MKKIFNFGSKKGQSPSRSFAVPRRDCGVPESDTSAGYLLRDKELGKLHKAASVGDVAKVQQLLLLGKHDVNDLDKVKRTPLHLACAKGYPDVVSLLVQRKCKLNLCDNDNRTPLIKAVQCQQEECATILLEHGADPNLVDSNNNTALHYAASGQNKAIAAQLLKHKGDIEAKNKEGYTPLLLAVTENNHDIVDFFLKNGANVNASDKSKSLLDHCLLEIKLIFVFFLKRLSDKPGADDSWPTTDDEELDFTTKICSCTLLFVFNIVDEKSSTVNTEHRTFLGHHQSDSEKEDMTDSLPKPSSQAQCSPHPAHPSLRSFSKSSHMMSTLLAINKVIMFIIIPILLSTFFTFCPFLPLQVDADDLDDLTQSSDTATEDYDLPPSNYKNIMLLIEQLSVDCKDSIHLLKIQDAVLKYERSVELKKARCTQLKRKVKSLENKITGLQEELSETRKMKSQLEHQKVEWDRELYRLRFTLKQEKEKQLSTEMLFEKTREQLRRKEEQYSKEVELKQQLEFTLRTLDLELRTVKSNFKQVEEERNDAQRQLSREQSARVLQDGILNNYLWKQKEIEAAASKMIQSSEVPDSHEKEKCLLHENQSLLDEVAKLKLELDTIKIKDQEKEDRYTEENEVLKEKNDELQKELKLKEEALRETIFQYSGQVNVLTTENTMLSSKLDNEKQNRDKLETEVESYRSRLNSAILDHERSQTSKLDLENIFQRERDEWLHLQDKLRDNNGVLSQELSKAESKANRLENELYQVCDSLREKTLILESTQRELNQTQNKAKELENKNQMDKEKLDRYIIKQESIQERLAQIQSENMLLRQQLEDAQNKGVIKEKVVNDVQVQFSDLFNKLRADTEKQVLLVEERNKELINECNHLREQMCKYENEKAEREVVRKLQQELADSLKKQSMTEASLEVTSRYRNDLEDKKKQLQKEVDQIKSKVCITKINNLLEIENARLEATVKQQVGKIENIQKNILDSTKLDTEREKLKKLIELKQSLENRLEQEMKRNDELQKDVSGFKKLLKTTKKKLREYEKGEVISQEVLKQTHFDEDRQINRLKNKNEDLTQQLEATSSKCIQLESINRNLREELLSMKSLQKKCDRLERNKRELEEEVVDLKHHLEITKLEHSQVEQYKREIEERANQEIVEKLKEVNLFLQTQAATQDYLEQSRENSNASIRNQMENRIRDLEAELSKMKNSHQDSTKAELEIYRQLYSEELKIRESLSNKLDRTNERLAELSSRLLNEKQKSRILINSFTTSPVLEPPHVGDLHTTMVLNRRLIPRGNLLYSTGNTVSSTNSMEAYLTKMRQELDKSISRELDEANAEFESRSCWAFPVGSTDESTRMPNLNQDPVSRATQEYLEVLKKNYML
uniref:Ankyrin repeat domain 26 n=1 Tax=Sarcophilus harrisii TaxID=9305 RepID=A0A7N4PN47_SARHA